MEEQAGGQVGHHGQPRGGACLGDEAELARTAQVFKGWLWMTYSLSLSTRVCGPGGPAGGRASRP